MTRAVQTLVVMWVLAAAGLVRAGIYMPGEPPMIVAAEGKPMPLPFDAFRVLMQDYMAIAVPQPPSRMRQECEEIQRAVRAKGDRAGDEDLIRLGAALLRMRQTEQAFSVLQSMRSRQPRNFVLQSQLALTLHQLGQPDAAAYQLDAISLRPKQFGGFSEEQSKWYLRVERILFEIWKARLRESKERGARAPVETVDGVFQVRFIGNDGKYEAGNIAEEEKAKLPSDAIAVVQQLLLWLPEDTRLYWLLGELYNVAGDIRSAATVLEECSDSRRFHPEELKEHRSILRAAIPKPPEVGAQNGDERDWRQHRAILWVLGAVGVLLLLPLIYWQIKELRRRT
jgi:tetratricopeptide (TPR) repeat protein